MEWIAVLIKKVLVMAKVNVVREKVCNNTNAFNSCNAKGPVVYGRGTQYSSNRPASWAWQSVSCSFCGKPRYQPAQFKRG